MQSACSISQVSAHLHRRKEEACLGGVPVNEQRDRGELGADGRLGQQRASQAVGSVNSSLHVRHDVLPDLLLKETRLLRGRSASDSGEPVKVALYCPQQRYWLMAPSAARLLLASLPRSTVVRLMRNRQATHMPHSDLLAAYLM